MENYEQKYKEALEMAKVAALNGHQNLMEGIFPELKESEFKVGNWYQCIKDFFGKGVTFDKNTAYYCAIEGCLQNEYGCHIAIVKDLYDNFKLWTIQDAKGGDILQANKCTLIVDSLTKDVDGNTVISSWYFCDSKKFYGMGTSKPDLWDIEGITPATKEQRELLFQKMKEADYMWDAEKKELKKIGQKPAWSEEDERNLQGIIDEIEANKNQAPDYDLATYDRFLFWLKSLKQRYTWKPSKEQMDAMQMAVSYFDYSWTSKEQKFLESLYKDLKKL